MKYGNIVAKGQKPKHPKSAARYQRVDVAGLDRGRRGKHHDLVKGILEELREAPMGAALEIPLAEVGVGLANLRSAVHRASAGKGITIETLADERNFYVWRKDATTQK
jgi:hypothetical protein